EEYERQAQAEQMALRQREMALRETASQREGDELTRMQGERETAARRVEGERGVRDMMAQAMGDGVTSDEARTIGVMAFREGLDVPPEVAQMQEQERTAAARSAGLADYESKAMIDASIDAQQPAGSEWASAGQG